MQIDYTVPVRLLPVFIPKPWGQEIWFTGMEARGESRVGLADGTKVPISRWLNADPAASSANEPVLLLKILDPLPEPVRGDLYFEVHAEKREVYIVTHVNPQAWPDGSGGIRFGMSQEKRLELGDEGLRHAYLSAVQSYEKVRRTIDAGTQSPFLVMQEMALRRRMDSFTHMRPLVIGDVVHVGTWFPHALQHGVRVVEFQTATYERLIVSFAQKVLTQDHWDTEAAVARMSLEPGVIQEPEPISTGIERIARFDHFNVWRARLVAGTFLLPPHVPYAVVIAVGGSVQIAGLTLEPEHAALVPKAAIAGTPIRAASMQAGVLIAAPGL
ncbi:MAG: hypothetical protein FJ194_11370 [Gammaproteobacteria bacterium]|nr:hypothetical protein [Gammaproteobacteria bacterium]